MRKKRDYIKIACEKLNMDPETLRSWLRRKENSCPFGTAILVNKRYSYFIDLNRLDIYQKGLDMAFDLGGTHGQAI